MDLSPTTTSSFLAQVGIDSSGESVAVWNCTANCGPQTVFSAIRTPSGVWSGPEEREGEGYVPELAVAPNGFAGAAWWKGGFGTNGHMIKTSFRSGGVWGPIETTIPGKEDEELEASVKLNGAYFPHIAVDAKGDAVAVWQGCTSPEDLPTVEEEEKGEFEVAGPDCSTRGFEEIGRYVIRASVRPAGGTWSKPVTLSKVKETAIKAKVAMDEKGTAIVVWEGDELPFNANESPKVIYAGVLRPGDPNWSVKQISPAGNEGGEPEVAFDAAGDATALWHSRPTPSSDLDVESAVLKAGGATSWSTPVQVSVGEPAFEPQLAVSADGTAVAIWRGAKADQIKGKVRTGGVWAGPETNLSAAGIIPREPHLDIDTAGDAVGLWRYKDASSKTRVQAVLLPHGGTWTAPVDLSEPGEAASEPDLDVSAKGSAVASWRRAAGSKQVIQSSSLTASVQYQAQSIPTHAAAGTPVHFSVAPLSLWPAVTTWHFGDGKTAQGNDVSHTYAKGGTYKVTVTSSDGAGNSASASGEISVAAGTLWVSQRLLKVSGNRVRVPVMCNRVGACNGLLKLVRGPKAKRTVLGKASFAIAAGKSRTLNIQLSKRAKSLLAANRRNLLSAAAEGLGVRQRSVVLKGKLAKRR